jgi:hypothetical protein
MNPKLCIYGFASLPIGAIFHWRGHVYVKLHKTSADEMEFCLCGMSVRQVKRTTFAESEQVDAECI